MEVPYAPSAIYTLPDKGESGINIRPMTAIVHLEGIVPDMDICLRRKRVNHLLCHLASWVFREEVNKIPLSPLLAKKHIPDHGGMEGGTSQKKFGDLLGIASFNGLDPPVKVCFHNFAICVHINHFDPSPQLSSVED